MCSFSCSVSLVRHRPCVNHDLGTLPLVTQVKEVGWGRLFLNGLPLRIVMIGTLTGAQWGEGLCCCKLTYLFALCLVVA